MALPALLCSARGRASCCSRKRDDTVRPPSATSPRHRAPDGPPRPGLVLVDGSGPATGTSGQGFLVAGRARGRHAAARQARLRRVARRLARPSPSPTGPPSPSPRVAALRAEAGVERAGLIGYSQGGWIALLAATDQPAGRRLRGHRVGPDVGVAEQERVRTERALRRRSPAETSSTRRCAWVDERAARLAVGDPPAEVLAAQVRLAGRVWHDWSAPRRTTPWRPSASSPGTLSFDPAALIPHLRCPILGVLRRRRRARPGRAQRRGAGPSGCRGCTAGATPSPSCRAPTTCCSSPRVSTHPRFCRCWARSSTFVTLS